MQNDRSRLIELIKQAEQQEALDFLTSDLDGQIDMSGGTKISCSLEYLVDFLIENGVGMLPPVNMENKCGSCIYAKPVVAFGESKCYVNCTNKEHIDKFCKREISTLRQRTHPACKNYKRKEDC